MKYSKRLSFIATFAVLVNAPLPLRAMMGILPHMGRSISLGSLTLTGVYPRIFTPNGDGYNDKAVFHLDNPELLPVTGEIFDLSGAKVANLSPGSDPASQLLWNGKDADGRTVAGGIYLYQIEFQGKRATGTVVVAR